MQFLFKQQARRLVCIVHWYFASTDSTNEEKSGRCMVMIRNLLIARDPQYHPRAKEGFLQSSESHAHILPRPTSASINPYLTSHNDIAHRSYFVPCSLAYLPCFNYQAWGWSSSADSDLIVTDLKDLISQSFRRLHRHHQHGWCPGLHQSREPRILQQMATCV
jgi:hypothetical protein